MKVFNKGTRPVIYDIRSHSVIHPGKFIDFPAKKAEELVKSHGDLELEPVKAPKVEKKITKADK